MLDDDEKGVHIVDTPSRNQRGNAGHKIQCSVKGWAFYAYPYVFLTRRSNSRTLKPSQETIGGLPPRQTAAIFLSMQNISFPFDVFAKLAG